MPIAYVHYDLQDGYIHNWLAGGPQIVPINQTNKEQIYRNQYEAESGISKKPVEQGTLGDGVFKVGSYEGAWGYTRCQEDHFIQHSQFFASPHYLRSWAYAQLVSKETQDVLLILTSYGPADLWVNGVHVYRQEEGHGNEIRQGSIPVRLQTGGTQVLVRFEGVAMPACNHVLALQVCKAKAGKSPQKYPPASKIRVRLPTTIRGVKRRNFLEGFFEAAYLDREIFGPQDMIYVRWPDDWNIKDDVTVRFQAQNGWTYGEATIATQPGERVFLGYSSQVKEGPYRILLTPKPDELYKDNTRIQREIPIWCSGLCHSSSQPYGTFPERRQEALNFAVRQPDNLFAEIAKMEIARWSTVMPEVITQAIAEVKDRQAVSRAELLGLLGMQLRFGSQPEFPEALKLDLEACILGFRYAQEQSDQDTMDNPSEGQLILLHACEILAGQLYPEQIFTNDGQNGQWHRQHGEKQALVWLGQRAASGFETWNAPEPLEQTLTALAHLVDLAEAQPVWEMAAALMDKVLFAMALNSFKGVLGASHKSTQSRFIRSDALQPTAGLNRLLWGVGTYNHYLSGLVSLVQVKNYEIPPCWPKSLPPRSKSCGVRKGTAIHPAQPTWSLIRRRMPCSLLPRIITPGKKARMNISGRPRWEQPPSFTPTIPVHPARRTVPPPNFWLGNRCLPRVAQWKDALIAIYNLPEDDWMGFTHAYFPAHAFDEYALRGGWAFARKGDGYLALTCSPDFQFIRQGHSAYCELRASGSQAIWFCQIGRLVQDGDFNAFQEKISQL